MSDASPAPARRVPRPWAEWLLPLLGGLSTAALVLACAALIRVVALAASGSLGRSPSQHSLAVPPRYGPLPHLSLKDGAGKPLDTSRWSGRLVFLRFTAGDWDGDKRTLAPLHALQERLRAEGLRAEVLLVAPHEVATTLPEGWQRAWDGGALEAATRRLAREQPAAARPDLLVLVDALGEVRGFYSPEELDPFTRGRVDEDALCLRTCGPLP